MAIAILSAIGAGLQLVLLFAGYFINGKKEHKEEVNLIFKEGLDAVKTMDATKYNFAIQHLKRLRKK